MIDYSEYSDMGLEEEYVRVSECTSCGQETRAIEAEFIWRGYTAREIRRARERV